MIHYIEVNLICFAILVGIGTYTDRKNATQSIRLITFNRLIAATILLCVTDIIQAALNGLDFPGIRMILEIDNILYIGSITVICFIWLAYVNVCIGGYEINYKKRMLRAAIPMFVSLLILFTNPLTGFTFTVNEANEYARADGIIVHWFFAWGYLIAAIVQTAAAIIKTKSRVQKNRLRPLLFFPVLPTLCAIAQMVFFGLSAMQAGITLSISLIAFSSLIEQVSRDELTGLGNRRRLNEYIENALLEERHFTLFMGDINGFKQINDKFGHIEGDKALQETADALRHACDHSSGRFTVFRYGGDEFVIISNHCTPEDVRVLNERIDRAITKKNDANKDGLYTLEISFGFAEGTCRTSEDVSRLFSQADDAMYEDKKRRKAAREKQ